MNRNILIAGFAVIAVLLAVIAYQVNRSTWDPIDQKCGGLFVTDEQKQECLREAKYQDAIKRLESLH